uniref:Uncharacterized protein n=1 Tax=Arundo donax TaxID=35708 RepID=A0A0A8ZHB9_ARUDO
MFSKEMSELVSPKLRGMLRPQQRFNH